MHRSLSLIAGAAAALAAVALHAQSADNKGDRRLIAVENHAVVQDKKEIKVDKRARWREWIARYNPFAK